MTAVLDTNDIDRLVRRLSHEIAETTGDDVAILGIPTRGVSLARRLVHELAALGLDVAFGILDASPHRDDVAALETAVANRTEIPFDVADRTVVLVDDVLFTGRTIRAALDALVALGRPARVRVAVLVDRGHRELPIRADYVGKNLPTSVDQRVAVRLTEVDGSDGVWIESSADAVGTRGQ